MFIARSSAFQRIPNIRNRRVRSKVLVHMIYYHYVWGGQIRPLTRTKKIKTFGPTCRFRMLDMRWKDFERAMNLSQVPAQGDAVFLAFSPRENPTKPYLGSKINRVAGRVIVSACGSVTIEVPMMRIPSHRASGRDREECE